MTKPKPSIAALKDLIRAPETILECTIVCTIPMKSPPILCINSETLRDNAQYALHDGYTQRAC